MLPQGGSEEASKDQVVFAWVIQMLARPFVVLWCHSLGDYIGGGIAEVKMG